MGKGRGRAVAVRVAGVVVLAAVLLSPAVSTRHRAGAALADYGLQWIEDLPSATSATSGGLTPGAGDESWAPDSQSVYYAAYCGRYSTSPFDPFAGCPIYPLRSVTNGATTNGSTTITSASANFTSADLGAEVFGTNIPSLATIVTVTNSTTATISSPATATGSGLSLSFGSGPDYKIHIWKANTDGTGNTCLTCGTYNDGKFFHHHSGMPQVRAQGDFMVFQLEREPNRFDPPYTSTCGGGPTGPGGGLYNDLYVMKLSDSSTTNLYAPATSRTVVDGVTTNGSKNISSASAAFTSVDVGMAITGSGIPANSVIASWTDGSHAMLSQNATATATGVHMTITGDPATLEPRWDDGGNELLWSDRQGVCTGTGCQFGDWQLRVADFVATPTPHVKGYGGADPSPPSIYDPSPQGIYITNGFTRDGTGALSGVFYASPGQSGQSAYSDDGSAVALSGGTVSRLTKSSGVGAEVRAYEEFLSMNYKYWDSMLYMTSENEAAPDNVPADPRTVADGVTTNASTTISSASAVFTQSDVGSYVTANGIPANDAIKTVTDSSHVVLTAPATATATGVSMTFSNVCFMNTLKTDMWAENPASADPYSTRTRITYFNFQTGDPSDWDPNNASGKFHTQNPTTCKTGGGVCRMIVSKLAWAPNGVDAAASVAFVRNEDTDLNKPGRQMDMGGNIKLFHFSRPQNAGNYEAPTSNGFAPNPTPASFTSPQSAETEDTTSATSGFYQAESYKTYGLTFPRADMAAGKTITVNGITVRTKYWFTGTGMTQTDMNNAKPEMAVRLSWDGGTTWTSWKINSTYPMTESSMDLGGTADTWGHTWTVNTTTNHLNDTNFRVQAFAYCNDTAHTCNGKSGVMTWHLDWVAPKVTYTVT